MLAEDKRLPGQDKAIVAFKVSTFAFVLKPQFQQADTKKVELRDPESFIISSKSAYHYLYCNIQEANVSLALERDTICVIWGCLLYKHSWKYNILDKGVSASPGKTSKTDSRTLNTDSLTESWNQFRGFKYRRIFHVVSTSSEALFFVIATRKKVLNLFSLVKILDTLAKILLNTLSSYFLGLGLYNTQIWAIAICMTLRFFRNMQLTFESHRGDGHQHLMQLKIRP